MTTFLEFDRLRFLLSWVSLKRVYVGEDNYR